MVYPAAVPSPVMGVYRCGNCGHEVTAAMQVKFLPGRCGEAQWDLRREEDERELEGKPRASGNRV